MINRYKLMFQAAQLREEMGEDNNSPVDILALALNVEDLTIVYYPLGDKLSGICIKGKEGNNVIAMNSVMTLGRQRFTLAHEFYHLYYDDTSLVSVCSITSSPNNEVERSADMFASYFLMPEQALMRTAEKLTKDRPDHQLMLDDMIRIEQYFGISHKAAVYRLMDTAYLKKSTAETFLNISVKRTSEALGYDSALYRPMPEEKRYMTYGYYINQDKQVIEKGLVSSGKYEELLLDAFRADLVYGIEEEGEYID